MNYDLTIFKSDDSPEAIFRAANTPKSSARGRQGDLLFAQLVTTGSRSFDLERLIPAVESQLKQFYKTSGSVTKAMRGFVDGLNKFVLQGNSHFDEQEARLTSTLCLGVIHYDTLFIAQIGRCSAHVMRNGAEELFFDPDLDRRGLGGLAVVNPRYFQTSLSGNESLLILPDPETSPAGSGEAFDTKTVLLQIRKGDGRIDYLSPAERGDLQAEPEQGQPLEAVDQPEPVPLEEPFEADTIPYQPSLAEDLFSQAVVLSDPPEVQFGDEPESIETEPGFDDPATQRIVFEKEEQIQPNQSKQLTAEFEEDFDLDSEEAKRESPNLSQIKEKALHGVAVGASWLRRAEEKTELALSQGKERSIALPGTEKETSLWAKILIAILVPLIVVGITSMIYFNKGEDHQYQYFLAQAQASVDNAPLMTSVESQRDSWEQALSWVNQAAQHKESAEVKSLRMQAQTALDALDGARRLQYVPAYSASLYPDLEIGAIISLNNDLYLLDEKSGSVKYMRLRNTGYEMDTGFVCGSGKYDGIDVGRLVDMISVPLNNPARAPILAIDDAGNLLYCSPTASATAIQLQAPDPGWAGLKKIVFDSNRLYVLDAANNALWSFRGLAANFVDAPVPYFKEAALTLTSVVDFEVEGEELFLLYEDGSSAHCLSSSVTGNLSCEQPYPYLNTEGVDNNLDTSRLIFDQLAYSPPPDPSIYYLDAEGGSLYQFSLRLNLNKVLRMGMSDGSLPTGKASAFFVSPDRRVFVAFGNQLFHAVLP